MNISINIDHPLRKPTFFTYLFEFLCDRFKEDRITSGFYHTAYVNANVGYERLHYEFIEDQSLGG